MSMMRRFLESHNYDEILEGGFELMYYGGSESLISAVYSYQEDALSKMVRQGILTYDTYSRMAMVIGDAFSGNPKIISRESEEIIMKNGKRKDSIDQFMLSDYILWFLEELRHDKLFRRAAKGHLDYYGIMDMLRMLSKDSDTHYKMFGNLTYAVNINGVIYGIANDIKEKTFIATYKDKKNVYERKNILSDSNGISDDSTIYTDYANGKLYYYDSTYRCMEYSIESKSLRKMENHVIFANHTGERIEIRNGTDICIVKNDSFIMEIGKIGNTILYLDDPDDNICWISNEEEKPAFYHMKDGKVCEYDYLKQIVAFRYILQNAYDFKMNGDYKMSSQLWKYKGFSVPEPFAYEKIREKLSIIESEIPSGRVQKKMEYADIIYPILTGVETLYAADEILDIFCVEFNMIESAIKDYQVYMYLPGLEEFYLSMIDIDMDMFF